MSDSEKKYPGTMEKRSLEDSFQMTGDLTMKKLLEYLPPMFLTNLSTLLLITVDGLVVGNFVGEDALSSVNIFFPITIIIGAASMLVSSGAAAYLSTSIGKNDADGIRHAKAATIKLMTIVALIISLVQVPFIYGIIRSYGLDPAMSKMTWQYAIGIMIATPFGLVSSVGVAQIQVVGKLKALVWLSATEGAVNVALDLLFVCVFHMGVAGAGFGTACANVVRCTLTVLFLRKATDIYNSGGVKADRNDIKAMLSFGLPETTNTILLAVQSYIFVKVILAAFGAPGGTIRGVCTFSFSLVNVFSSAVYGAVRSLMGLMSGGHDSKGLKLLMRQSFILILIFNGIMMIAVFLVPTFFYHIHGVDVVPEGGVMSLRLYSLYFVIHGFDVIYRLYFVNRKDTKFATSLTLFGNISFPIVAWILMMLFPAPCIWLAYLVKEAIIFGVSSLRYKKWRQKDVEEQDDEARILYLTVKPDDAVEVSRLLRHDANEHEIPERLSYRVALCMEEMVSYAAVAENKSDLASHIVVSMSKNKCIFMMIDNGRCIALNENKEQQKLVTNNYELIKKVATSVEYQYILDMNYTVVTLEK